MTRGTRWFAIAAALAMLIAPYNAIAQAPRSWQLTQPLLRAAFGFGVPGSSSRIDLQAGVVFANGRGPLSVAPTAGVFVAPQLGYSYVRESAGDSHAITFGVGLGVGSEMFLPILRAWIVPSL